MKITVSHATFDGGERLFLNLHQTNLSLRLLPGGTDVPLSFTMSRQPHQRLEGVLDLSGLSGVSDDVIVACIRERFMADNIYTRIGTSALVVLNPHKYISSNADNILQNYAAEYRNTTLTKEILPPHIFQLANNAYYHMKRTTQDQSIILRSVPC